MSSKICQLHTPICNWKNYKEENRTAAIVNIKSSWMAIGASLQFSGQKQHPCKAFEGLLLYWRTQELKWFKGHPEMRVYWKCTNWLQVHITQMKSKFGWKLCNLYQKSAFRVITPNKIVGGRRGEKKEEGKKQPIVRILPYILNNSRLFWKFSA